MQHIDRPQEPDFLAQNAHKWNTAFANNKAKNPAFTFQWATHQGKKVNTLLLPLLRHMTQNHCSFCDSYPLPTSKKTIEHFRPKTAFPAMAYTWENLFYCCDACQDAKLERFEDLLLKPDEASYRFEDYFLCDFKTGELKPNTAQSADRQARAEVTLRLYDLNREDLCIARLKEQKAWAKKEPDEVIDDYGYRYFLAL